MMMIENTTHKNYQERRRPPTIAMVASLNADNDETTLLLSVPTDNNSGNTTSLRKRHYLATALVVAVISMMGTLLVVCVTNIHTQHKLSTAAVSSLPASISDLAATSSVLELEEVFQEVAEEKDDDDDYTGCTIGQHYEPWNMPEHGATYEASLAACNQRCRTVTGCVQFSYWPDNKSCNVQDDTSSLVATPADWSRSVAGPVTDCGSNDDAMPILDIEQAIEGRLQIGNGLSLWYRTWGNKRTGIPVLFVHGGPGNAISDYGHSNKKFFDAQTYYVVEVDQRGTGKSQPSVRDGCHNMQYYRDITIATMSHDYELIRNELQIEQWLIFGGSWGSTLSLDYSSRYPQRCLGVILRGIFLNTEEEFQAVYARKSYTGTSTTTGTNSSTGTTDSSVTIAGREDGQKQQQRLAEFDTYFNLAAQYVEDNHQSPTLDPNDAERFVRVYERMIERCDTNINTPNTKHADTATYSISDQAVWHWHVFENNLMEENPRDLLNPTVIEKHVLPEAASVSFFEARLFLHGTFEQPINLLERVHALAPNDDEDKNDEDTENTFVWICQGRRDEVCPQNFAQKLVDALEEAHVPTKSYFIDSGHVSSNPVMHQCLENALTDFSQQYLTSKQL